MPNKIFEDFSGGCNWFDDAWGIDDAECFLTQNFRLRNGSIDSILGTKRFHDTPLNQVITTTRGSLLLDGTGDYLSSPDSDHWQFGQGVSVTPFTLELWVRFDDVSASRTFFAQAVDATHYITFYWDSAGNLVFEHRNGGATSTISKAWSPSINTWYHVALSKAQGTTSWRFFVDGVQQGTTSTFSGLTPSLAAQLQIGMFLTSTRPFIGRMDEIRISNVQRYSSDFTVATTPFQNDNNTLLLIHCDGNDGDTNFTDHSGFSHTLLANGNAQVDNDIFQISTSVTTFDNATCIMPYYNDETDNSEILCAAGANIYKRNKQSNDFTVLKGGLTPNKISSHCTRFGVMYIPSEADRMLKYLGGNTIETVGSGDTQPDNFKQLLYMREIDRIFGIRNNSILGQIGWCELSDPETWIGDSVERFKLRDGEIVEGGGVLYGKLIVFCTYSIWVYYVSGNEENWRLEEAPTNVGLRAFNTLRKVGNEWWFLGESPISGLGIYAFNGSVCRKLTQHMQPLFDRINSEKINLCAAELHDDLYTFSFPYGSDTFPRNSIDLDTIILREDGTPAIYAMHDFGFQASCVLNSRHHNKEFLMCDPNDGYIYKEHGTTWKATHDTAGQTIINRFVSKIYSDEINMMKLYREVGVLFRPTGYFQANFSAYFSYGTNPIQNPYFPIGYKGGTLGEFDVFQNRIEGSPQFSEAWFPMAKNGTSIQFEINNANNASKLSVQGFRYGYKNLHTVRKAQYAQASN